MEQKQYSYVKGKGFYPVDVAEDLTEEERQQSEEHTDSTDKRHEIPQIF